MHKIADIATGVLILAGITVMVRPNSKGPDLVAKITGGYKDIIVAATTF